MAFLTQAEIDAAGVTAPDPVARASAVVLPRASFSRIAVLMHSFGAEQISWGDGTANPTTGKFPAGTTPNEINWTANGWINALQRRIGHRFDYDPALNKGVGGETSAQILARYDADIRANKDRIDTLFVDIWTNDGPAGLSKEQSWANFLALFAKAKEDNLALVTTTISPRPQNSWSAASSVNKELW